MINLGKCGGPRRGEFGTDLLARLDDVPISSLILMEKPYMLMFPIIPLLFPHPRDSARPPFQPINGASRPIRRGVFVLFGLCLLLSGAESAAASGPLDGTLAKILKRELPAGHTISIRVVDLETGRILMEKNPHTALVPASTMKTVTSAAALAELGPDYTFKTEVFVDGRDGDIARNIYLRGKGDPYLVSERLFKLTRQVRLRGLSRITGDIIVDDSHFIPGKPLDQGEELGKRAYHAPYGALSLNFNAIEIIAEPASRPGLKAEVRVDPVTEYARIEADVKTLQGKRKFRPEVTARKQTESGGEIVHLLGGIGVKAPIQSGWIPVEKPAVYAGEVFKEFLLREGIAVAGAVKEGEVPKQAEPLLEYESLPLALLVYYLNKYSNNFMAEQVAMGMGADAFGVPGTRPKGLAVIQRYLESLGIPRDEFSLSEASGLSRKNRISAAALVKVLLTAANDFRYGPEFTASLPIGGVDGTLKNQFIDRGSRRRIRAKTGSLRGVTAMAGYGIFPKGRRFAFAILINSTRSNGGYIDYDGNIIRRILDIPVKR